MENIDISSLPEAVRNYLNMHLMSRLYYVRLKKIEEVRAAEFEHISSSEWQRLRSHYRAFLTTVRKTEGWRNSDPVEKILKDTQRPDTPRFNFRQQKLEHYIMDIQERFSLENSGLAIAIKYMKQVMDLE